MDSFKTIYLLLCALIMTVNAEFSTHECRELGFIKTQLMCSSCNDLKNFGLGDLEEHCNECCQKDNVALTTKRLDPIVKLYDENDSVVEVLSINKWNTDAVEEFFATHLHKNDDSDKDYLRTNRI